MINITPPISWVVLSLTVHPRRSSIRMGPVNEQLVDNTGPWPGNTHLWQVAMRQLLVVIQKTVCWHTTEEGQGWPYAKESKCKDKTSVDTLPNLKSSYIQHAEYSINGPQTIDMFTRMLWNHLSTWPTRNLWAVCEGCLTKARTVVPHAHQVKPR